MSMMEKKLEEFNKTNNFIACTVQRKKKAGTKFHI